MKYKDIIVLLASVLLIVTAWIIFNIYHNSVVSTAPDDLKKETLPITPTFDQSTINKLNSRTKISPIYDFDHISPSPENPTVTPEVPKEQESSPSALTASPGGELVP